MVRLVVAIMVAVAMLSSMNLGFNQTPLGNLGGLMLMVSVITIILTAKKALRAMRDWLFYEAPSDNPSDDLKNIKIVPATKAPAINRTVTTSSNAERWVETIKYYDEHSERWIYREEHHEIKRY